MRISEFFSKLFRSGSESQTLPEFEPAPSIHFSSIRFNSGKLISLGPTDIVVIVGPNNAGKSRALRDLDAQTRGIAKGAVCSGTLVKVGKIEDFVAYVKRYSYKTTIYSSPRWVGEGFEISENGMRNCWAADLDDVSRLFCQHLGTETRITDSNAPNSIATFSEVPKHPIHRLVIDDDLEQRISKLFQSAFAEELILYRAGGAKLPLFVGKRPAVVGTEDRVSISYLNKLRQTATLLQEQGDGMRSFASVILFLLASETQSMFLVDEPEAFLHPPQARRLGEVIARDRMRPSQLFVSTHSPDILTGLLSSAAERLRIVRIERGSDGITVATELEREKVHQIATDPVMKFSSVLEGLFHRRVVVCESDSDCLFYSTMLDAARKDSNRQADVLFLQVGGKDRMSALVQILRDLRVTVDVIADIDVIGSNQTFIRLIEALGGDFALLKSLVKRVEDEVGRNHSWLSAPQIVEQISEELKKVPANGVFPREVKSSIERTLRKLSPWSALKEAGAAAIPKGDASASFDQICRIASESGLWIVPVGELEGFCRSQGGHGPAWVQETLRRFQAVTAPELEDARIFMQKIWERIPSEDN